MFEGWAWKLWKELFVKRRAGVRYCLSTMLIRKGALDADKSILKTQCYIAGAEQDCRLNYIRLLGNFLYRDVMIGVRPL